MRKKIYFTLGQIHSHPLPDGNVWDKDGVVMVDAPTTEAAVDLIVKRFGGKWANYYEDFETIKSNFKNGIVYDFYVHEML